MDNLTKDAMAARKAGMTYGKYKGRQYEAEQAAKAKAERERQALRAKRLAEKAAQERMQQVGVKLVCVWCGREFWGMPRTKTCSKECREARNYEVQRTLYYRRKGTEVPLEIQYMFEEQRRMAAEKRKEQEEAGA